MSYFAGHLLLTNVTVLLVALPSHLVHLHFIVYCYRNATAYNISIR